MWVRKWKTFFFCFLFFFFPAINLSPRQSYVIEEIMYELYKNDIILVLAYGIRKFRWEMLFDVLYKKKVWKLMFMCKVIQLHSGSVLFVCCVVLQNFYQVFRFYLNAIFCLVSNGNFFFGNKIRADKHIFLDELIFEDICREEFSWNFFLSLSTEVYPFVHYSN